MIFYIIPWYLVTFSDTYMYLLFFFFFKLACVRYLFEFFLVLWCLLIFVDMFQIFVCLSFLCGRLLLVPGKFVHLPCKVWRMMSLSGELTKLTAERLVIGVAIVLAAACMFQLQQVMRLQFPLIEVAEGQSNLIRERFKADARNWMWRRTKSGYAPILSAAAG